MELYPLWRIVGNHRSLFVTMFVHSSFFGLGCFIRYHRSLYHIISMTFGKHDESIYVYMFLNLP